jgi:hypothetical protein
LLPPDDGLLASPKHVEAQWLNKVKINSASGWFHHAYFEMHGQQNIKFSRTSVSRDKLSKFSLWFRINSGIQITFCGWSCHVDYCLHAGIIRNWNGFQFSLQVVQGLPREKYTYCTLQWILNYTELRVDINGNSHGLWMWHVQAVGICRVLVYIMTTQVPTQLDYHPVSVNAMPT